MRTSSSNPGSARGEFKESSAVLPEGDNPPRRYSAAATKGTVGVGMKIVGEIRSDEELVLDGEVEGTIESGGLVTIGRNGTVRANIRAREVVIFGSVKGNIEATEKLAIRDQGSLVGDARTAGISIDDG